jgi:hypothetical protein
MIWFFFRFHYQRNHINKVRHFLLYIFRPTPDPGAVVQEPRDRRVSARPDQQREQQPFTHSNWRILQGPSPDAVCRTKSTEFQTG